ncbi:MAG: DUF1275 domain-containing protein [Butyrivibrio sp.]|nr:DUF1275 domain-containing protein [Butyrivibrio sp.]
MQKEKILHIQKKDIDPTEQAFLYLLLSFSGGFQDAYTFIVRKEVFANAQTGNIVLMAYNLIQKQWGMAFRYLLPVVAFVFGVFVATQMEISWRGKHIRLKEMVLVIEAISLFAAGLLPDQHYRIANMLVSFSCAIQVQSFPKLNGNNISSTMCIGNMRSGVSAVTRFINTRDKAFLFSGINYWSVILVFALGAGTGAKVSDYIGIHAIWFSTIILIMVLILSRFMKSDK